jgi:hypothetical protein
MLISHRYKCIFAHVPKCAGTSLKEQLELDFVAGPYWHCTWEEATAAVGEVVMRAYLKFAVVRNPWERVVSAWKMFEQKPWCRQARSYSLAEFLAVVTDEKIGFRDRHRSEAERRKWMQSPENIRHHCLPCLLPYYGMVDRTGQVRMDRVIGYDRLDAGLNEVFERIGAPARALRKENTTQHAHYSNYYDPASRHAVSRYYAGDIRAFGFRFEAA